MIPLLQAAGAVAAAEETLTGLSHTTEKLGLFGVMVAIVLVEAWIIRFLSRKYFAVIEEQKSEYKARIDADALARRSPPHEHPPTVR